MGQKVHPYGLRLGINKTWKSLWFVDPRDYAKTLHEDLRLRKALFDLPETKGADISDLQIVRQPQRVTVIINTARPGVIIGAKGATIEKIGEQLQKLIDKKVAIKIKEIKKPDTDAQIVALNVARQLKNRGSFRKALKQSITNAMKNGAQGIKIKISGRLGGAEMARTMEMKEGRVPLQTLRADLDYGFAEAFTTYGAIGVKVWVFNGEKFERNTKEDAGVLVKKSMEKKEGN
jgi:small subunit ribosomal protein S3